MKDAVVVTMLMRLSTDVWLLAMGRHISESNMHRIRGIRFVSFFVYVPAFLLHVASDAWSLAAPISLGAGAAALSTAAIVHTLEALELRRAGMPDSRGERVNKGRGA